MVKKVKCKIYNLPARFPVEVDGVIVNYGRTAYQAAEIAHAHGATELEVIKCGSEFVSISLALPSSATSSRKGKPRGRSRGKSSPPSSPVSGPSQSSEQSSGSNSDESENKD